MLSANRLLVVVILLSSSFSYGQDLKPDEQPSIRDLVQQIQILRSEIADIKKQLATTQGAQPLVRAIEFQSIVSSINEPLPTRCKITFDVLVTPNDFSHAQKQLIDSSDRITKKIKTTLEKTSFNSLKLSDGKRKIRHQIQSICSNEIKTSCAIRLTGVMIQRD